MKLEIFPIIKLDHWDRCYGLMYDTAMHLDCTIEVCDEPEEDEVMLGLSGEFINLLTWMNTWLSDDQIGDVLKAIDWIRKDWYVEIPVLFDEDSDIEDAIGHLDVYYNVIEENIDSAVSGLDKVRFEGTWITLSMICDEFDIPKSEHSDKIRRIRI